MNSKENASFPEKINKFRKRIAKMTDSFPDMTEEATKNALIMPFFNAFRKKVLKNRNFYRENSR